MRTAVACARMARSTLGVCSDAALHEARGLAVGESLDALRERVEVVGVAQRDEQQRARHHVTAVPLGERTREMEGRCEVGPDGRELGRRRLDPDDAEGHVRPVGELVDRTARRPGRAREAGAEVAQERRRRSREAGRPHEAEPNGVADVQPEPLGEHEAGDRLVDRVGVRRPPLAEMHLLQVAPEAVVVRQHREQVDRTDTPTVAGAAGEQQADGGARRRPHLGQARHLVEVDRTGEAEVAAPGDDQVGGVQRPAEVAVGVAGAHRAREQPEHHAAGDPRDQRHPQPRRPPMTELRPETQGDRGHRATVPGALNGDRARPHAKLHDQSAPPGSPVKCPTRAAIAPCAVARRGRAGSWPSPWSRPRWSAGRAGGRAADLAQHGRRRTSPARRCSRRCGARPWPAGVRTSPSPTRWDPTEVAFPALQAGTYDAYADYQGTLLTYLGGTPTANSAKTHAALVAKLQGTGITVSAAAPAVDVNGFFVTRKTAKKFGLRTVSDLAKVAPRLTIGAPPSARPDRCASVTHHSASYGMKFAKVVRHRSRRHRHATRAAARHDRRRGVVHRQQHHPRRRGAAPRRQGTPAGRQPGARAPRGGRDRGHGAYYRRSVGRGDHERLQRDVARHQPRSRRTPPRWPPAS